MNALNRRIQGLEEDLEKSEDKLLIASQKLDKAGTGPIRTNKNLKQKYFFGDNLKLFGCN